MSAAADGLVDRLPRIVLVVGKGGVGKTTTAAALALHSSRRSGRTLVVTTDPARALPEVLGQDVGDADTSVAFAPGLAARVLDAGPLRARFMAEWGDVIRVILDRGTYLDQSDIDPLVDTALPGSDEIFSAFALAELIAGQARAGTFQRIVVDTAPTGHTLRLLQLPRTFRGLVRLLDAMQAKHRFMVRTLTRRYRPDAADAFLNELTALVEGLEAALGDPTRTAAVMVAHPEALVRAETRRYLDALAELRIHVAALVWNQTDTAAEPLGDMEQLAVPRLAVPPVGAAGLARWLGALGPAVSGAAPATRIGTIPTLAAGVDAAGAIDALLRPLTIVAGKGGVGKTTVAAALALHAARRHRTLVVSTDPAPSLGDALASDIGDAETPVAGMPGLFARQMDATAAFARLREEYQARVDAVFQELVGSGVDLAQDRAVIRDLLSLAPPGVDEVYALSLLSEALSSDRYERVIVDPAPTGHLLRLLEMPQLALSWCHQLLRLMLKYKEVAGLGESAADLLAFSKGLRGVDALLHDEARAAVVLVTLDEPVVVAETVRLAREVRRRRVAIAGLVLNRAAAPATLPEMDAPLHLEAPAASPPPAGRAALDAWLSSWTTTTA